MLSGGADNGVITGVDENKMLPPSAVYVCSVECEGVSTAATIKIVDRIAILSIAVSGSVVVTF
jgi:hypothetical protein